MHFSLGNRVLMVAAIATALAGCGRTLQHSPATPEFSQRLTDTARSISTLPADVERIECQAEKKFVADDRVVCNVFLQGRAPNDVGENQLRWDIPVRPSSRFDDGDARFLDPSQFNLALLSETGFQFVAKNGPQGLSMSLAVNQNRVTFQQALEFVVAVLPAVSQDVSKQLDKARDEAPDAVRATWAKK